MKAPQIIYIVLVIWGLLIVANKHGKPRENWNFWTYLISVILAIALLMWGGFFK